MRKQDLVLFSVLILIMAFQLFQNLHKSSSFMFSLDDNFKKEDGQATEFAGRSDSLVDLKKISFIESSNNPKAHHKASNSMGLFQITPICLKEYNNFHPGAEYSTEDLWNASVSTVIADWYINNRIPQMLDHYNKPVTTENVLIAYNAGISYVVHDKPLPEITKDYIRKYYR